MIRRLVNMTKVCFIFSLVSAIIFTASGWLFPSPRLALERAASIASISAVLSTSPLVAKAVDFSGSYADPFHPNCQRVIVVPKGSNEAKLKGTDGNPGCPADGSGTAWQLSGKVDGDSILVDFRPKGGPADLKGVWDPTSPVGIKWPDGNKWTIKSS